MRSLSLLFLTGLTFLSWQNDALTASIKAGKEVYNDYCVTCHKADGTGLKNMVPPLAKADFLLKNQTASIHAIKYGIKGPITVNGVEYKSIMVSQNLSNEEIADVMNYINHTWGNSVKKMVTPKMVAELKE
jgi:mono/diheme cytochrome c family protein